MSGRQFGDDTIALLLSERHMFDNLHWLDLSESRTTDRGAAFLVNFPRLRRLDLRGTAVGHQVSELVGLLPQLQWIGLPPGAIGPLGRLAFRWRRPELRFARQGEACGTSDNGA